MLTCTQWKISLLICSNFATRAWIFSDKQNTTTCLRDFSSSEPLFSIYQYFPNSQLSNRRQPAGRRTTPKPRIHLPHTQASRPLNRSTATRHSCAVLCTKQKHIRIHRCLHTCSCKNTQTYRHTCAQRYVSTESTYMDLCTHTHVNIQTPKHTHIPPA